MAHQHAGIHNLCYIHKIGKLKKGGDCSIPQSVNIDVTMEKAAQLNVLWANTMILVWCKTGLPNHLQPFVKVILLEW